MNKQLNELILLSLVMRTIVIIYVPDGEADTYTDMIREEAFLIDANITIEQIHTLRECKSLLLRFDDNRVETNEYPVTKKSGRIIVYEYSPLTNPPACDTIPVPE